MKKDTYLIGESIKVICNDQGAHIVPQEGRMLDTQTFCDLVKHLRRAYVSTLRTGYYGDQRVWLYTVIDPIEFVQSVKKFLKIS